MNNLFENNTYKSPLRKLVKFFEQSRDKWKTKCLEAKAFVKQLKNKVRNLETSRTHWKEKAVLLKEKVTLLELELAFAKLKEKNLNTELNELKKNAETEGELVSLESFNQVPVRHTYSLGYIMLFIELVLKASISLTRYRQFT